MKKLMTRYKIYLMMGCLLSIAAIIFIFHAISNPQASFPWSNSVTYIIYIAYGLLTGLVWGLAFKSAQAENKIMKKYFYLIFWSALFIIAVISLVTALLWRERIRYLSAIIAVIFTAAYIIRELIRIKRQD